MPDQPYNPFAGGQWSPGGMMLGANPYYDPSMMDPSMMTLGPQMGLAQNLITEGTSTAPTLSPWAGLSRLAGALLGSHMMRGIGQEYQKAQAANLPSDDVINTMTQGDPGMMKLWGWAKDHPYQRQQVLNQIVQSAGTRMNANIDTMEKFRAQPVSYWDPQAGGGRGDWVDTTNAAYAATHGGQYPPGQTPPTGVYGGGTTPGVAPQGSAPVPTTGQPATGDVAREPSVRTVGQPTGQQPAQQPTSVADLQKAYPEAINAPPDVQEKAAIAFYRKYGGAPWTQSYQAAGLHPDPIPSPNMTDDQIRQRLQGIAYRESGSRLGGSAQDINNIRNQDKTGQYAGMASGIYQFMPKSWQEALGLAYGGQQAPLSNVGKTMVPPPGQDGQGGQPPPASFPGQGGPPTAPPGPATTQPPLQGPVPATPDKGTAPPPPPQDDTPQGPSAKAPMTSAYIPPMRPTQETGYTDALNADRAKIDKDTAGLSDQYQYRGNLADMRSLLLHGMQTGWAGGEREELGGMLKQLFGTSDADIKDLLGIDLNDANAGSKIALTVFSAAAKAGGPQTQEVWQSYAKAFPGLETQPGALDLMTNVLDMGSRYQEAYINAEADWQNQLQDQGNKTGIYRGLSRGTINGMSFNQWFKKNNPYGAYVAAAKALTDPSKWTDQKPLQWGDDLPKNQQGVVMQLLRQRYGENTNTPAWFNGQPVLNIAG